MEVGQTSSWSSDSSSLWTEQPDGDEVRWCVGWRVVAVSVSSHLVFIRMRICFARAYAVYTQFTRAHPCLHPSLPTATRTHSPIPTHFHSLTRTRSLPRTHSHTCTPTLTHSHSLWLSLSPYCRTAVRGSCIVGRRRWVECSSDSDTAAACAHMC